MSRSVPEFSDLLARYPGKVVPLDIGIDPGTIAGEFTATVVAAAAQMERRLIGQRTGEALQAARERGVRLGHPRTTSPEAVELIQERRAAGQSYRVIADEPNARGVPTAQGGRAWHAQTVRLVALRAA
jgi:DNA invertase Pin-like site-specific DNA recombinase